MSKKDAMQFPLIGSGVLFGLYMVVKLIKKEYLDILISIYFSFLGAFGSCLGPASRTGRERGRMRRARVIFARQASSAASKPL